MCATIIDIGCFAWGGGGLRGGTEAGGAGGAGGEQGGRWTS